MTRAFVLSGGAALGAIEVGMLQALFERGVAPDLIVGTSVGAINGAFIASREPTVATALELGQVWRGLRRGKVFPVNPLTGFIGFIGASDHLVPEGNLRRLIAENIQVKRLEQMRIPLHVIVTDVLSGQELRLSEGPAVDAVLASAAIPGVFSPIDVEGRRLMDGGVANNTPLSHAVELGADEIYVLPTGFACSLTEHPRGALGMLLHAENLLVQQRLHVEIGLYRDRVRVIVLPPPCPQPIQPIDFDHARELIDHALAESRTYLDWVKQTDAVDVATRSAERLVAHTHTHSADQRMRRDERRTQPSPADESESEG
jgi:NTE family protein